MHDGVVLKDHRQAGVRAEKRELYVLALARKSPDAGPRVRAAEADPYTHLTLPTIYTV